MKKLSSILILSIIVTACAFKEPDPGAPVPAPMTYKLSASWGDASTHVPSQRKMNWDAGVLKSADPITLPKDVPAQIDFSVALPTDVPSSALVFAKGTMTTQGVAHDILVQLLSASSAGALAFRVQGLDSLFPHDHSQDGSIHVDFFSGAQKVFSFEQAIRTPASQIESDSFGIQDLSRVRDRVSLPARRLVVGSTPLILVHAFEITNRENTAVVLDLPRRPGGQLAQWRDQMSYQDIGCNGSGYQINHAQVWDPLSEQVYLLPLQGSLIAEAQNSLSQSANSSEFEISLNPGESIAVGIFASGTESDRWNSQGPLGSDLSYPTVQSDCYNVCTESEPPTNHSGGGCSRCGLEVLRPELFVCDRWETRRHTSGITVGAQRGDVQLQIPNGQIGFRTRFGDLDFAEDPESRSGAIPLANESIQWVPAGQ